MLSDDNRGFILEVILSKIKYSMKEKTQIIGMSATLPNISDLATWLGAALYTTTYRPVNLSTVVCWNKKICKIEPILNAQG